MGWGITVNGLYISRTTEKELLFDLEQTGQYMDSIRNNMIALVANTSNVYVDGDETVSIVDYSVRNVPDLMEEYARLAVRSALLQHAIDNPEDIYRLKDDKHEEE